MEQKDQELFNKFSRAVSSLNGRSDEAVAIDFFAGLNQDEYDSLIDIFTNNQFPDMAEPTREKLLLILKKLKGSLP